MESVAGPTPSVTATALFPASALVIYFATRERVPLTEASTSPYSTRALTDV
jgi:hypothetical protein